MEYLEKNASAVQVTGTVVELADGRAFRLSHGTDAYAIDADAVLTVVTVEGDRLGERKHTRRYSPAAWISVVETSDPAPPGQISRLAAPSLSIRA